MDWVQSAQEDNTRDSELYAFVKAAGYGEDQVVIQRSWLKIARDAGRSSVMCISLYIRCCLQRSSDSQTVIYSS